MKMETGEGDRICGLADKRSGSSSDFLRQLGHFTVKMEDDVRRPKLLI